MIDSIARRNTWTRPNAVKEPERSVIIIESVDWMIGVSLPLLLSESRKWNAIVIARSQCFNGIFQIGLSDGAKSANDVSVSCTSAGEKPEAHNT